MQNTTWAVIYIPDIDKTVLRLAIVKWAMSESFYVFESAVIILWDNILTADSRNWWNWWKEPTLCLHWEIIWMLTFVMYFLKCLMLFVAFHSKKKLEGKFYYYSNCIDIKTEDSNLPKVKSVFELNFSISNDSRARAFKWH